jgi:flagellar assembly protein FliH
MNTPRRNPDWFERHDAEIRELAWLGTVAGAPHPATLGDDEPASASAPVAEVPAALLAEREARGAAEQKLAETTASLDDARAALEALRAETESLRVELSSARTAANALATRMRDDAERELVSLAMAVAERVVGRELATTPELIVDWAREAVAGSDFGGSFVVATSTDLSAAVPDAAWGELEDALRMDPALPAGSCELRDGGRTVTVSAEERLETVGEDLANVVGSAGAARAA